MARVSFVVSDRGRSAGAERPKLAVCGCADPFGRRLMSDPHTTSSVSRLQVQALPRLGTGGDCAREVEGLQ